MGSYQACKNPPFLSADMHLSVFEGKTTHHSPWAAHDQMGHHATQGTFSFISLFLPGVSSFALLPPVHATDLSQASQVALQVSDLLLFFLHCLLALVLLPGDSALQHLRIDSPQFQYRKNTIVWQETSAPMRKATGRVTAPQQGHVTGEKLGRTRGHSMREGTREPGGRYPGETKEELLCCSSPGSFNNLWLGNNHSQSNRHTSPLGTVLQDHHDKLSPTQHVLP